MAKAKSGMLPRQEWDEINVSHDRVKNQQKVEMVPSKEMKQLLKMMKAQKSTTQRKRK